MKIKDVNINEIFTIGETPSYPKLRTKYGYIDMRDKIKNNCGSIFQHDVRLMNNSEVTKSLEIDEQEIIEWKKICIEL